MSMTHPPPYIHTHHPRRGSLTPIGLHVISPVPPAVATPYGPVFTSISPIRNVGFSPPGLPMEMSPSPGRRESTTSSNSTLTQTRPFISTPQPFSPPCNRERRRSSLFPTAPSPSSYTPYPLGFDAQPRRASLTPSIPKLAPPSQTPAHAKGRVNLRPTSSDGNEGRVGQTRNSKALNPLTGEKSEDEYGRRGSLPQLHLHHGTWSGPPQRTWNPSLAPQRGSFGDEGALPTEDYKFGSIPHGPSAATAALRAIAPIKSRGPRAQDVFQQTEEAEAERQRKAFIAATFGDDGRRARARLSLGGSHHTSSGGSPGSPRRPSLMLWERLGMVSLKGTEEGSVSAPAINLIAPPDPPPEEMIPRRGSLPIAIPIMGGNIGRNNSRRSARAQEMDISRTSPGESDAEDEEAPDSEEMLKEENDSSNNLTRPLPPLLPLSDPGPRHLPSTLALHRATHLLHSRNLQSVPLPHPLPPSLHPPAPVDLTEFDIDFILAGSLSQLGDETQMNQPVDILHPREPLAEMPTPTLKLGADEEDSFARFVGKFDDEYGDRRGEWTFRICSSPPDSFHFTSLDPADPQTKTIRSEWEAPSAGKYQLFSNGEVRSIQTGSIWRVRRTQSREYELEQIQRGVVPVQNTSILTAIRPTIIVSNDGYVLTGKATHKEYGGAKSRTFTRDSMEYPFNNIRSHPNTGSPGRLRVSISEASPSGRTNRIGSTDYTLGTSTGGRMLSSSVPLTGTMAMLMPKKKRRPSKDVLGEGQRRGREDATEDRPRKASTSGNNMRSKSKDRDKQDRNAKLKDGERVEQDSKFRDGEKVEDDKNKKEKIGFFRKGIMASIKSSSFVTSFEERKIQKEEKEREREKEKMQSQSWGGYTVHHTPTSNWSSKQNQVDLSRQPTNIPKMGMELDPNHPFAPSLPKSTGIRQSPKTTLSHLPKSTDSRQSKMTQDQVDGRRLIRARSRPPLRVGGQTTSNVVSTIVGVAQVGQVGLIGHLGSGTPTQQLGTSASKGPERAFSSSAISASTFSSSNTEDRHPGSLGTTVEEERQSTLHTSDNESGYREGKGWKGVPEDAVAMIIPIEGTPTVSPTSEGLITDTTTSAFGISVNPFHEDGQFAPASTTSAISNDILHDNGPEIPLPPSTFNSTPKIPLPLKTEKHTKQALLVWYVPFNSTDDVPPPSHPIPQSSPSLPSTPRMTEPTQLSSLPKFQKLLRRRTSKDQFRHSSAPTPSNIFTSTPSKPKQNMEKDRYLPRSDSESSIKQLQPLPFRSFRIVARVVDLVDLNSEPIKSESTDLFIESNDIHQLKSSRSPEKDLVKETYEGGMNIGSDGDERINAITAGRSFPTVIAVCHSRSQGVEFVLEGLDRLGFCNGESAWGPTGYEEWRGSGLSEKGRELVDVLWAGCTGVMGLMGV
ncbi:hypothetical protein M231_07255 [Tremella mesenterica]|uniref:Uncharacterized protein n=1 Tax=Tremella mesenterica TaxID=5217 RepID=A0A4Q1BBM2_TREME|nr:hypothetical protein M231_07255 [Tremella mesenterica]